MLNEKQTQVQGSEVSCEMALSELYGKYHAIREDFSSLSGCMPDMLWAKDLDGVYTYANSKVAYQLYRIAPSDMLGKTDEFLAKRCKEMMGPDRFTFGAMCADSDNITMYAQKPTKFLERGLVDGDELILMVHKNVKRNTNTGRIIGTVGVARNVTSDVRRLETIAMDTTDSNTKRGIDEILGEFYYPNKEMVGEHL